MQNKVRYGTSLVSKSLPIKKQFFVSRLFSMGKNLGNVLICVKMLPNVYHPKERPWVQIENATTEELIAQISKCPSGALSYRLNKKEK